MRDHKTEEVKNVNYKIGEIIEDFNTKDRLEVLAFNKSVNSGSVNMRLRNINTNEVKVLNGYIAEVKGYIV